MSKSPAFLFAHGAGAGSSSPWMLAWAERLRTLGRVVAFDYPYMAAGRKAPDRHPVLERAHQEALGEAQGAGAEGVSWFLAGKSMGSRIGCHVAVANPKLVKGIICFGYPLVAGATGAVRDEVLRGLRVPILFVQGTRDPLCPLERLRAVCAQMTAPARIFEVPGGNHSLEVSRSKNRAATAHEEANATAILLEVTRFVAELCGASGTPPSG